MRVCARARLNVGECVNAEFNESRFPDGTCIIYNVVYKNDIVTVSVLTYIIVT